MQLCQSAMLVSSLPCWYQVYHVGIKSAMLVSRLPFSVFTGDLIKRQNEARYASSGSEAVKIAARHCCVPLCMSDNRTKGDEEV